MIKIPVSVFSLLICSGVFAQGEPSIGLEGEKWQKKNQVTRKRFTIPESYAWNRTKLNPYDSNIQMDTARYSHSTPSGNVYLLPGSNMPMLKPNQFYYTMPGTAGNDSLFVPKAGNIPNAIRPRGLYFEKPSNP